MRRLILSIIFSLLLGVSFAQKIVTVSGEFIYYAPPTMSMLEAKQEALLQTRLHVLAKKFGTQINSTSTLILQNSESSAAAVSRSEVTTLATHEVKGDWLEDTREPEQEIMYDKSMPNTTIIKTKVWGKAREIVQPKADIVVALLKDTIKEATADVFQSGQNFYMYFSSPVSGYLAIYLLDANDNLAFCLQPTAIDSYASLPIRGGEDYILFSSLYAKKHYLEEEQNYGTQYIFTSDRSVIFNQLMVIFSPNEFAKAKDIQAVDEHYTLPRQTTLKEFDYWISRCKTRDNQMISYPINVKIVKER